MHFRFQINFKNILILINKNFFWTLLKQKYYPIFSHICIFLLPFTLENKWVIALLIYRNTRNKLVYEDMFGGTMHEANRWTDNTVREELH